MFRPGNRFLWLSALVCVSTLCAAVPLRASDAALTVGIQRSSNGLVRLDWPNALNSDGFGLRVSTGLEPGPWSFAGGPDRWPTGGSNVWVRADQAQAMYRLESSRRGQLFDVVFQQSLPAISIGILLAQSGITGITPSYGVSIYRITYETFDPRGLRALASGALCVPEGLTTAPIMSLQHGTIYEIANAPSTPGSVEQALGVAAATEGYIALLPDYLGLGTNSPALHPYVHARSEAVACVDMLRASVDYMSAALSVSSNGRLFLAGYSQGGHATLAFLRELESHHAASFPVTACAPMAGPHDLSGVMRDIMLADAAYGSPSYLPYALLGLNGVYGLFDSPAEVFAPPYDTIIPPLFDGLSSAGAVDSVLPAIPRPMLEARSPSSLGGR